MTDFRVPVTSSDLPGRSPLGVVKRDPEPDELHEALMFAASEVGFVVGGLDQDSLNTLAAQGEAWAWEDAQLRYLETDGWYIANKPRQMGMSAVFSVLALARGLLAQRNYTAIFASYKKEEAVNKINYVKQFLECLPLAFRKEIIRDPLQLIEWRNANNTISKIISHAQKPIRGHHGDVWLDEFAFFQDDRLIYESCLPVTSQVNGSIHIGSTPFGKSGMFYEIVTDRAKHTDFTKQWIAWWHCKRYLRDSSDHGWQEAAMGAPKLTTEERVYKYGNDKILKQFRGLDLETFQQEFEGYFVDEQAFFFSRNLIMNAMFDNLSEYFDDYDPVKSDFTIPIEEALEPNKFSIQKVWPNVFFKRYDTIQELAAAVRAGQVSINLYAGVDVGITRHSTDIRILEEIPIRDPKTGKLVPLQVERFAKNKGAGSWDPEDQENYLLKLLSMGIIQKMIIDANGAGRPMAMKLKKRFPTVVEFALFNSVAEKRNRFMNNLKSRLTNNALALAFDRLTIEELHCIKSVVNQSKTQRFTTDEKKLHHGDGAWALAFASMAGTVWGEEYSAPTSGTRPEMTMPGYQTGNPELRDLKDIESASMTKNSDEYLNKLKRHRGPSIHHPLGFNSFDAPDGFLGPGEFIKNYDD